MTTPIDYGKEFLENYWHNRDATATLAYLADDVVWITPDEIRHLKSHKELLQFMQEEMDKDPRKYNVDIASIRSAPTSDQSSTIVYEVNLIPIHTEKSVNLRCSLAITRVGERCELTFVGMSRKYKRSNAEQIRGFIESLPSGVLVLTSLNSGDFRAMYGNTYFAKRLGYDEDAFYDRIDENPFFMMPYEQQRQMMGFAQELAALKRPRPLVFRVELETQKGKTLPFQVIMTAAYKDGSRTIYYVLFNDLSAIEQESARQHKKAVKEAVEAQKAADLALLTRTADKAQHTIDTAQQQTRKALEDLEALQARSDEELATLKEESESRMAAQQTTIDTLQETIGELQRSAELTKGQHDKLIAALKEEAADTAAAHRQELLQQQADIETKAQQEIEAVRSAAQEEREQMAARLEEAQRNAAADHKAMEQQIAQLQAQIRDQQLGMARQETIRQMMRKEETKSAARVEALLRGQTSRLVSLMEVLPREENKEQAAENIRRAADTAAAIPDMAHELLAIGTMDTTGREELCQEEFSLADALETIRRVVQPQCRERGVVFALEIRKNVPDSVRTCKAALQMVLLSILENAAESTTRGGRITLAVKSDPAIKGKAYYHYVITDTGSGIDEAHLTTLFDEGEGELSVTRKVLSRLGGSINVTTEAGSGSRFEIALNLEIGGTSGQEIS